MRLFLIERTPLADLSAAPDGPAAGDAVAFFRHGLDPGGGAARALAGRGVEVLFAEGLLGRAAETALNGFINEFLRAWHRDGDKDFSRAGHLSLGRLVAYFLVARVQPGVLIRSGEVFRALLGRFPETRGIVTDIVDGVYPMTELAPDALPRRRLLGDLARERGIGVHDRASSGIPVLHPPSKSRPGFGALLATYLGGFRPAYLLARIGLFFRRKAAPRVYFFLSHALWMTAAELARKPGIEVFCDQSNIPGATPLRHDHLFPLAPIGFLRAAWRLRRLASERIARGGAARFNGFDYGPYLAQALRHFCADMGLIAAVKASQTLRMWRRLDPNVVVTGSDVPIPMLTAILSDRLFGYRVVNIEHGLNSNPYGTWAIGCNHPNLTVIVPGDGQMDLFGSHQPAGQKPRRVILPIPVTSQMEKIRGTRRPPANGKGRVLILSYAPAWAQTPHRAKNMDRYTLEVLQAARVLIAKGIRVSLRPPPTLNFGYFEYMLRIADLEGAVALDRERDFTASLARHDVMVSNLSSCYYQALYAGWPTIFYEPDFDRRDFLGLIADATIDPPRAETPERLVQLVEEALSGKSRAATFPAEFRDKYLERFLGPRPEKTDEQLAQFLYDEALTARRAALSAGDDVPALAR
jgi:hypothetical protein